MSVLDDIILDKRQEVAALKTRLNVKTIQQLVKELPATRDFYKALPRGKMSLLAEIKKASPSTGVIASHFEPTYLAQTYQESGAAAISVLTDEKYFQGKLAYLTEAKDPTTIPILRKDFIIDAAQIYESRIAGADAILLIAAVLDDGQLNEYLRLAHALKMCCLVEIRDEKDARRVLRTDARIVGINNRDLATFKVDLNTTKNLLSKLPALKERVVVSESGISTAAQVKELHAAGVSAILVGTSLMRSQDVGKKIRELMG
jgi:indole-3-glycerol phosphate synthase